MRKPYHLFKETFHSELELKVNEGGCRQGQDNLGNYCGVKRVAQESCAENYMDIMHRVRIGALCPLCQSEKKSIKRRLGDGFGAG